jgi:hypothetical protein
MFPESVGLINFQIRTLDQTINQVVFQTFFFTQTIFKITMAFSQLHHFGTVVLKAERQTNFDIPSITPTSS